jgi:hypothetical protein
MTEHCYVCRMPVEVHADGSPVSKYWRSRFSENMRIKEREIVEVYCGAQHSLDRYKQRGRK